MWVIKKKHERQLIHGMSWKLTIAIFYLSHCQRRLRGDEFRTIYNICDYFWDALWKYYRGSKRQKTELRWTDILGEKVSSKMLDREHINNYKVLSSKEFTDYFIEEFLEIVEKYIYEHEAVLLREVSKTFPRV